MLFPFPTPGTLRRHSKIWRPVYHHQSSRSTPASAFPWFELAPRHGEGRSDRLLLFIGERRRQCDDDFGYIANCRVRRAAVGSLGAVEAPCFGIEGWSLVWTCARRILRGHLGSMRANGVLHEDGAQYNSHDADGGCYDARQEDDEQQQGHWLPNRTLGFFGSRHDDWSGDRQDDDRPILCARWPP